MVYALPAESDKILKFGTYRPLTSNGPQFEVVLALERLCCPNVVPLTASCGLNKHKSSEVLCRPECLDVVVLGVAVCVGCDHRPFYPDRFDILRCTTLIIPRLAFALK